MEKMNEFSEWEFIESNLPDYSWNEDVALSNDLSKYIHGEFNEDDPHDCRRLGVIMSEFGTKEEAEMYMRYIDCKLYVRAYENWVTKTNSD